MCLFGCLFATLTSLTFAQSNNQVWLVPIDREITTATEQFIKSRIERANKEQPLALVFYIDTPGGQILAAEQITDAILLDAHVPTIAVVENAISAGALIAISAENVAMLPGSSIGAATAINAFTGENAGEKVNSFWRAKFRSVAEQRNRNADVAEGMVSESVEIPGLSTASELITLTAAQAVEYDIADIQAKTLEDALSQLGYGSAEILRLEPNLAERLGGFLTNPFLAALLLAVGIGGIVLEALTPGFGLPGIIGILALVTLGAGLFFATPAGIWDLLLILIGIVLLVIEILFLPGFGIPGILGLAAVVIAIVRLFPGEYDWAYVLGYASLFAGALLVGFFWLLPNSRFTKVFALSTRIGDPTPQSQQIRSYEALLGQRGIASSDLRPAGIAKLGQERLDVVSEGEFISNGSDLEVLRVEGTKIVVRKVVRET
jgi:membrane-bound serine protease (ClpP class)